jgi:hypothetical protein
MEKPEYFQCNPGFAYYKDSVPMSRKDEPYIDIFTNQIRWKQITVPSKIYLNNKHDHDYTDINNWPRLFEK